MKTEKIEKAANDYAKSVDDFPYPEYNWYDCDQKKADECFANIFTAGAEYALSHQWVSVDEALPEFGQEVLLYDSCSIRPYVVGWRRPKGDNKSQWHITNGFVVDDYITHWMPIPKLNNEKR